MRSITIQPISYITGNIDLPGSKSISNRLLLLAALARGKTELINLLDSDDVRYMLDALKILGIKYQLSHDRKSCIVDGCGTYFPNQKKSIEIFVGNAGTVIRSLSAVLALSNNDNDTVLTGTDRMKKRPIEHLVDALQQGGAQIEYLEQYGYPPIKIKGGFTGGNITVDSGISSQFLTALLIAAPLASVDTIIRTKGNIVSKPYIYMTIQLMRKFGVKVDFDNKNYRKFYIKSRQIYVSLGKYLIEGDASSASYFLAAAAIKGGKVRVTGIDKNSIQGDVKFAQLLKKMGAQIYWGKNFIECQRGKLFGVNMDMNETPDAAMTLAMLGLFARGETVIRNIYNWRSKESDRLAAMTTELGKVGAKVESGLDYIRIIPSSLSLLKHAEIKTYDDHRVAMCLSLIALSNTPVTILHPNCTAKTFPDYFNQLEKLSYRYQPNYATRLRLSIS